MKALSARDLFAKVAHGVYHDTDGTTVERNVMPRSRSLKYFSSKPPKVVLLTHFALQTRCE